MAIFRRKKQHSEKTYVLLSDGEIIGEDFDASVTIDRKPTRSVIVTQEMIDSAPKIEAQYRQEIYAWIKDYYERNLNLVEMRGNGRPRQILSYISEVVSVHSINGLPSQIDAMLSAKEEAVGLNRIAAEFVTKNNPAVFEGNLGNFDWLRDNVFVEEERKVLRDLTISGVLDQLRISIKKWEVEVEPDRNDESGEKIITVEDKLYDSIAVISELGGSKAPNNTKREVSNLYRRLVYSLPRGGEDYALRAEFAQHLLENVGFSDDGPEDEYVTRIAHALKTIINGDEPSLDNYEGISSLGDFMQRTDPYLFKNVLRTSDYHQIKDVIRGLDKSAKVHEDWSLSQRVSYFANVIGEEISTGDYQKPVKGKKKAKKSKGSEKISPAITGQIGLKVAQRKNLINDTGLQDQTVYMDSAGNDSIDIHGKQTNNFALKKTDDLNEITIKVVDSSGVEIDPSSIVKKTSNDESIFGKGFGSFGRKSSIAAAAVIATLAVPQAASAAANTEAITNASSIYGGQQDRLDSSQNNRAESRGNAGVNFGSDVVDGATYSRSRSERPRVENITETATPARRISTTSVDAKRERMEQSSADVDGESISASGSEPRTREASGPAKDDESRASDNMDTPQHDVNNRNDGKESVVGAAQAQKNASQPAVEVQAGHNPQPVAETVVVGGELPYTETPGHRLGVTPSTQREVVQDGIPIDRPNVTAQVDTSEEPNLKVAVIENPDVANQSDATEPGVRLGVRGSTGQVVTSDPARAARAMRDINAEVANRRKMLAGVRPSEFGEAREVSPGRKINVSVAAAKVVDKAPKSLDELYAAARKTPMAISSEVKAKRQKEALDSLAEAAPLTTLYEQYQNDYERRGFQTAPMSSALEENILQIVTDFENTSQSAAAKLRMAQILASLDYPQSLDSGEIDDSLIVIPGSINGRTLGEDEVGALERYIDDMIDEKKVTIFDPTDEAYDANRRATVMRALLIADLANLSSEEIEAKIAAYPAPEAEQVASPDVESSGEIIVSKNTTLDALIEYKVPKEFAEFYVIYGNKHGVSPALLAMMGKQESINFDKDVVSGKRLSPAGAKGIAQFMDPTWAEWKEKLGFPAEATPFIPRYAIEAQAAMMANNLKIAKGDVPLALAGYNAGFGAIEKHGKDKVMKRWRETRDYIAIITADLGKVEKIINRLENESGASRSGNIAEKSSGFPFREGVMTSKKARQETLELAKQPRRSSQLLGEAIRPKLQVQFEKQGLKNGRLDTKMLARINDPEGRKLYLAPAAAAAWNDMAAAYKAETGRDLIIMGPDSAYRTYSAQERILGTSRPGFAARPGTSNHGWGLAVDIRMAGFDDPAYIWLEKNANEFGFWSSPRHRKGGEAPEPWHWNFMLSEYNS